MQRRNVILLVRTTINRGPCGVPSYVGRGLANRGVFIRFTNNQSTWGVLRRDMYQVTGMYVC